jgi:hypothetical protein
MGDDPALAARLLGLADALPDGGTLQLDARALRSLAGVQSEERGADVVHQDLHADYTLAGAGRVLGVKPNTVRGYVRSGDLGAYVYAGAYRITHAALEAFLEQRRQGMLPSQIERRGRRARTRQAAARWIAGRRAG